MSKKNCELKKILKVVYTNMDTIMGELAAIEDITSKETTPLRKARLRMELIYKTSVRTGIDEKEIKAMYDTYFNKHAKNNETQQAL